MRPKLSSLDKRSYDVAIIGGGINGAAAAQHIAAQGNSVIVVDKGDFGSGSSSRSTRLLHCGLRYLAPGRSLWDFVWHPTRLLTALKMAKQSMEARAELVSTAPSRARTMEFAFPVYKGGPYKGWQIDLAFRILKLLGPSEPPLEYRRVSGAHAIKALPLASQLRDLDEIESVALYREYEFDWPERVCLDAILDAERMGATTRNYTKATLGPERIDGMWPVALIDQLDNDTATVFATVVLNMSGIWIDDVNAQANTNVGRRIFGTKGAHILVKLPKQFTGYGVATLNSKMEPFYCIPFHDLHFFGPTETLYESDKDDIHVAADEQAWLLQEARRLLPSQQLEAESIILTWAGVRPLTFDPAIPFGNRSRVLHDLSKEGLPNVLALTAGPVGTHRSAGRMLAKEVARRVRPKGVAQLPNFTPPDSVGNENSPPLVVSIPSVRLSDLQHGIVAEHAVTLMDLLFRRTGLGWRHQFSPDEIEKAAAVLATERRLSVAERQQAVSAFHEECRQLFGNREHQ